MAYKYEYAICALLLQSVVTYRFFSRRRFPNIQNRLFEVILIIGIIDIVLDIASSIMIQYTMAWPFFFVYIVNTGFYAIQIFFPIFLILYTISIIKDYKIKKQTIFMVSLPGIAFELFLFTNIFHKAIFYVDPIKGYVHNTGFYFLYLSAIIYIFVAFYYLIKYRKHIRKIQYNVLFAFMWIIIIALILQYIFPAYLLTGLAISLAIAMIYFTLQNPYDMLDSFTKTFNVEAMQLFIESKISSNSDYQFIVVNIDGMRRINNLFGVLVGNELMLEVSNYLNNLNCESWVFKLQGTRFVIVTFNDNDHKKLIEELDDRFERSWIINDMKLKINVNIRYFNKSKLITSSEDVINMIDMAFNRHRLIQDNQKVKRIDTDILLLVQRQSAVEKIIREALDKNQGLTVYYQPIYSLEKQKFTSMEALVRCDTELLGSISPGEFIPIAEKRGLILRIDEFVINEVLSFLSKIDIKKQFGIDTIEINLSAAEFISQGFFERFVEIFQQYDIDANMLVFEVTETAATISYDVMVEYMAKMNEMGIRFAIDDFGKGYANLTQVLNLPFSMVKLDRSLLISDSINDVIFKDILLMFKKLDKEIVVEGVETKQDLTKVIDLCPDHIQGFYYAKPMPIEQLIEFLSNSDH